MAKAKNSGEPDMAEQVRFILNTGKRIHETLVLNQAKSFRRGLGKDISVNQLHMLRLVRSLGGVGVKELADRLNVSAPSVSAMVDRLVDMGLLTREQSRRDRRQVVIQLSSRAVSQIERLETNIQNRLAELAQSIGADNTQKWYQVMREIAAVFDGDERDGNEKQ